MAYDRDGYEKTEHMGGENIERKHGLEVEQGTWGIRTNQELWELYTYLDDSSTH
jgi:hypothetical protein